MKITDTEWMQDFFVTKANKKHSFISSPAFLLKKVEEECPVDDTLDKVAAKEDTEKICHS